MKPLHSIPVLLVLMGTAFTGFAQVGMRYGGLLEQYAAEQALFGKNERMHTAVWPQRERALPSRLQNAWLATGLPEDTAQAGPAARFELRPMFDMGYGYSSKTGHLYTAAAGVDGVLYLGERWALRTQIFGGSERLPGYLAQFVDSLEVVPGLGRNLGPDANQVGWLWPSAELSYSPSAYFQVDLGFGSQHFGSGYRSFMLSDVAYNYPYLRLTTDVWHFKYTNLFAAMAHVADEALDRGAFEPKYMAAHHLSWAVSKRVTFSVFESVVWQGRDSLTERSFDPHYLNPVIFYRPVEFAMGSPDRMLIGADVSVRLGGRYMLYGQVVFDEFLLEFLRERTGWWANKWAIQAGATAYDAFGIEGLRIQAEYNMARPFMYSHGSVVQNYAHFHQPLAHPLGSNFREGVLMLFYQKGWWHFESHGVFSRFGRDDGPNMGGDLFRSYANPFMEFGNVIGQGLAHEVYFQRLSIGRMVYEPMGLRLSLRYTYRGEVVGERPGDNEHFVGIHLSTDLRSRYRDF